MSTFHFLPPSGRYDLTRIILGEASGAASTLEQVSSSLAIGSFPDYISTYTYAGSGTYYYAVKWEYANGGYSDWSTPRMLGRTGISTNYIIVNAPSVSSIYIMAPVSGDIVAPVTQWMSNNQEYTITIDKTLSGGLTLPMTADYTFSFTTKYCPLFASVNDIRYEAGDYVANLSDDTINRIIYKNSTNIILKYINIFGGYPSNYTCDGSLLNTAFARYVVCKSAFDAITAIQLSVGGRALKKLADVTFEYQQMDVKRDPLNMKQQLKECIDTSLNILLSGKSFQVGVRSRYFSPLPHPMHDPTFGRLSLNNRDYRYNNYSIFDEQIGLEVSTSGVSE